MTAYQSPWTTAPLCSVTTVALPIHSSAAAKSAQVLVACQWAVIPAGDSYYSSRTKTVLPVGSELGSSGFESSGPLEML